MMFFICALTTVQAPAGTNRRSGENHFFLIKELAEYPVIQAHFVAFLTGSLQDTPGKTKAAPSDAALPCPLG